MPLPTSPQDARRGHRFGLVGMLALLFGVLHDCTTVVASGGEAAQVNTVTVTGATASKTYSIVVNGITVSHTAPGSGQTTTTIAAGLAAAVNAEPLVRGQVRATSAVAVVTLTALTPGVVFTVTESDTELTTASVTTAASAATLPHGVLVAVTANDIGEGEGMYPYPVGRLADKDNLTAQVDSYVVTYDASVEIRVEIEIDGEIYRASHTMATDLDTSLAALVIEINAQMPANTVLASDTPATATTLVLTSEVPGKAFRSAVSFGPGRDTGAAVKTSNAGIATDITRCGIGVSVRRYDNESTSYAGNDTAEVCRKGYVFVESSEAIVYGDPVYVELDGTNAGKFFKTAGSTRVLLPRCRWESKDAADTIATLYFEGGR